MEISALRSNLQQPYQTGVCLDVLYNVFGNSLLIEQRPEHIPILKGAAKSIERIAALSLTEGRNLAVLQIKTSQEVKIERNRIALRDIAFRLIDQDRYHGLLVFYYSESTAQQDYRMSFISKNTEFDDAGNLVTTETHPKRYSYVLGPGESCTTAAQRFLELKGILTKRKETQASLKDLVDTFNVGKLNDEFFKKYRDEHYRKFWRFIADVPAYRAVLVEREEADPVKAEKPIRDFVKKMLGRIVFLHFLQKKGWMGCPASATAWVDGDKAFMQNLFANFADKESFYSNCLTDLFFNTLNNAARDNGIFHHTGTRVPYLNGGLYDDDQPQTNPFNFPAVYFKDLLEFFEQYNFTIDENSPDEQEVGIDPEMLGHIFENLLEENREKGTYYTPKEIVHYMCKESLVRYLCSKMPECADCNGGEASAIADFINNGLQNRADAKHFVVKNAKRIEALLDAIKVCDPAIGSGAFPMGMLQEIFKAKLGLDLTLDRAKAKKDIIQNSIYGVDMEKGAVDIARLRFWLSLVVDEEEPQPLPNLDFKIMQGNSLLESFEGLDLSKVHTVSKTTTLYEPQRDIFGNIVNTQLKLSDVTILQENDVQDLMQRFFSENTPAKKLQLRQQINETVHRHIDYNLEQREMQLARQIGEAPKPDAPGISATLRRKVEQLHKQLEQLQANREKLHSLQNADSKPYFLWHLFFADVFEEGGFDVVIGNPPYRPLMKMGKDCDTLEKADYETFSRMCDIYCLFYELGFRLLKDKGTLTFITSNKWMRADYGKYLRSYFIAHTNPISLIDFGSFKVFTAATVDTNILIAEKAAFENKIQTCVFGKDFSLNKISDYVRQNSEPFSFKKDSSWVIVSNAEQTLKAKIESAGVPLKEWDVRIFRGILTGCNDAFIIDGVTRDRIVSLSPESEEIIRPILRGKDIKRYEVLESNQWVLFVPWHFPLQNDKDITGASLVAEKAFQSQYPAIY